MNINDTSQLPVPARGDDNPLDTAGGPNGADEFAGDIGIDPLSGAVATKRVNTGLILIVAVVLLAAAGLFSMRKLAEATAKVGISPEIEKIVNDFLESERSEVAAATAGTPSPFDAGAEYTDVQIPWGGVGRDPFILQVEKAPTGTTTPVRRGDPEAEARRLAEEQAEKRQERHDAMQKAAKSLQLKSILGGARPMALIEDGIISVGETIYIESGDVTFRVLEIGRASVELVARDADFDLTVNATLHLDWKR